MLYVCVWMHVVTLEAVAPKESEMPCMKAKTVCT